VQVLGFRSAHHRLESTSEGRTISGPSFALLSSAVRERRIKREHTRQAFFPRRW
jgi:hypothetical protein